MICNINVLRYEDLGDIAAIGMGLTRRRKAESPGFLPAEVPVRAVIMEAYK